MRAELLQGLVCRCTSIKRIQLRRRALAQGVGLCDLKCRSETWQKRLGSTQPAAKYYMQFRAWLQVLLARNGTSGRHKHLYYKKGTQSGGVRRRLVAEGMN